MSPLRSRSTPLEVPATSVLELCEHDRNVLLWQVKGESRLDVDGVAPRSAPVALWIPVDARHSFTVQRNSSVLPMFFPDDGRGGIGHPTIVTIDDHLETACLALVSSYYSLVEPPADLTAVVRALIAVQIAIPDGVRMPTSLPALRIARSLLLSPGDRRTLADWSRVVHLSTRSLERAFSSETGLTWRQWRQVSRMRAGDAVVARQSDVRHGDRPSGRFRHPQRLHAPFREFHGISPTEFRDGASPAPADHARRGRREAS